MKASRHTYYHTCPYCNANLDPNEVCDCRKENAQTNDNYQAVRIRGEKINEYDKEKK